MNPEEDYEAERHALFAVFDEARKAGVKLDVECSRKDVRRGRRRRRRLVGL